jgi:hypothetical protein
VEDPLPLVQLMTETRSNSETLVDFISTALDLFAMQGNLNAIKNLQSRMKSERSEFAGCDAILRVDQTAALAHFETAHRETRKRTKL